ncbi:MAG: hypothetical protein DRN68_04745 [Thaumarchaeota archaeon]|nr:MAG: hypothetical protein DRN68_04745 [Nitrososphaerota archaeon]
MEIKVVKEEDMWKVLVDGLTYDYFENESDARRMATLIEKAEKTIEEIREQAQTFPRSRRKRSPTNRRNPNGLPQESWNILRSPYDIYPNTFSKIFPSLLSPDLFIPNI